jgi:hypothetical protein
LRGRSRHFVDDIATIHSYLYVRGAARKSFPKT